MNLQSGVNIQIAIDLNPPGTLFQLAPGIYRNQHLQPKQNDQFVGDPAGGTIFSGSIELQGWMHRGLFWIRPNLPPPLTGKVVAGSNPLASSLNDLFIDNTLLHRVGSASQVGPGTWYFDPGANAAVIAMNPSGHTVEYSIDQSLVAAGDKATGVVLRDLRVEKYATDAQVAPVHGVHGWRIINLISTQNHGAGLNIASGTIVQGGRFNQNGQIGINGWAANDTQVLGAEMAANNYAGYSTEWEAGGLKLAGSSHVMISGNNVHDNHGQGLWGDIDDRNFTILNNTVTNNTGNGIMYEISYGASVIRDNSVMCNGGAGIYISNSSGVDVSGNTIVVGLNNRPGSNGAAGAGGIDVINDFRDPGPNGAHDAVDNNIHDNLITHHGDSAQDGTFIYRRIIPSNTFDHNVYHVRDKSIAHWHADRGSYRWRSFVEKTGMEAHGQMLLVETAPPDKCQTGKSALIGGNILDAALLFIAVASIGRRRLDHPKLPATHINR